jgi:hypothetical protein
MFEKIPYLRSSNSLPEFAVESITNSGIPRIFGMSIGARGSGSMGKTGNKYLVIRSL